MSAVPPVSPVVLGFSDLGVSPDIARALASKGIQAPFAVQTLAIPDALARRDVLVRSRTGSGKTLAFAIPIVEQLTNTSMRPSALILTPTRELASQVANEIKMIAASKQLQVAVAYGGTSVMEQARAAKKAHILVATPGRLQDFIDRRLIRLDSVSILVLDEADHMLDMGFLPQVDKIVATVPKDRQTMLFSATLDGEVGRIAKNYTRNPVRHELESPKPATNSVEHRFIPVSSVAKADKLVDLLRDDAASTLVFVRTKHGADRLVKRLSHSGIEAAAMHGDKSQSARERALWQFSKGKVATLVATDVAARGLDVDNIMRVINFDMPADDKAFVHRVGRTGRAGRTGKSITFVAPEQHGDVGRMAARLQLHEEFGRENAPVAAVRAPGGRKPGGHTKGNYRKPGTSRPGVARSGRPQRPGARGTR